MAFIDYLEDMPLVELVLQETYSQIRATLFADQPSMAIGPTLKNLGYWLGLQTLARDKGVSEERLPLKEVILSATHRVFQIYCVYSPLYLSYWVTVSIATIPSMDCRHITSAGSGVYIVFISV